MDAKHHGNKTNKAMTIPRRMIGRWGDVVIAFFSGLNNPPSEFSCRGHFLLASRAAGLGREAAERMAASYQHTVFEVYFNVLSIVSSFELPCHVLLLIYCR